MFVSGFLREDVGAARLYFYFGIWFALEGIFHSEASCKQIAPDLLTREENKIERNLVPPEVVFVVDFQADVKGQKQQAAWTQYAAEFAEYIGQFRARDVQDGIKGDQGGESTVLEVE